MQEGSSDAPRHPRFAEHAALRPTKSESPEATTAIRADHTESAFGGLCNVATASVKPTIKESAASCA